MKQDLIIDFIGQIANKDVEVVRCVFLVGGVGLVGPVDADFLRTIQNLKINLLRIYTSAIASVVRMVQMHWSWY